MGAPTGHRNLESPRLLLGCTHINTHTHTCKKSVDMPAAGEWGLCLGLEERFLSL